MLVFPFSAYDHSTPASSSVSLHFAPSLCFFFFSFLSVFSLFRSLTLFCFLYRRVSFRTLRQTVSLCPRVADGQVDFRKQIDRDTNETQYPASLPLDGCLYDEDTRDCQEIFFTFSRERRDRSRWKNDLPTARTEFKTEAADIA